MMVLMESFDRRGLIERRMPASAETWGAAIDVPVQLAYPSPETPDSSAGKLSEQFHGTFPLYTALAGTVDTIDQAGATTPEVPA